MLWFGIAIFSIIMLIYTTVQERKKAKSKAERMGERLYNLKNDVVDLQKTEKPTIKHCPDCSGKLNHDGRVYVCELCGATYSEKELFELNETAPFKTL